LKVESSRLKVAGSEATNNNIFYFRKTYAIVGVPANNFFFIRFQKIIKNVRKHSSKVGADANYSGEIIHLGQHGLTCISSTFCSLFISSQG
jgi:hypothetical protein